MASVDRRRHSRKTHVAAVHNPTNHSEPITRSALAIAGQQSRLDVARDVERRVVARQQRVGLQQVDLQHDQVDADGRDREQRRQLDPELARCEARDQESQRRRDQQPQRPQHVAPDRPQDHAQPSHQPCERAQRGPLALALEPARERLPLLGVAQALDRLVAADEQPDQDRERDRAPPRGARDLLEALPEDVAQQAPGRRPQARAEYVVGEEAPVAACRMPRP